MDKKELIQIMSAKSGLTQKDCGLAYNAFLEAVADKLNIENECQVSVPGLGTIKVKIKEAHESKNPRTKAIVQVPTKREARMSLSDTIKNKLIQP